MFLLMTLERHYPRASRSLSVLRRTPGAATGPSVSNTPRSRLCMSSLRPPVSVGWRSTASHHQADDCSDSGRWRARAV